MKQLLTAFAKNTVFANISLIMILVAGALAAATMIRENFPEFSLDIITVSVAYPGADPEEVEEGVSRKIEEALEGVEGIKQVTTHSNENAAAATIEVKEGYPVAEVLGPGALPDRRHIHFPGGCRSPRDHRADPEGPRGAALPDRADGRTAPSRSGRSASRTTSSSCPKSPR